MAVLTEKEKEAWQQGLYVDCHKKFGALPTDRGVQFNVWAPKAKTVHLAGDFNEWNPKSDVMERQNCGIWGIENSQAAPGHRYKFLITPREGEPFFKSDPYARRTEGEPQYASIVHTLNNFEWNDTEWMARQAEHHRYNRPLAVYEVHLGSWKRIPSGDPLTYRQIAAELIPYAKKMGFTHIELMPVMEHPHLPSWGYQITNYFTPSARYGSPDDFKCFIDSCHQNNIGVILDWVPGHFPCDAHGLQFFDGSPLFEHADSRRRDHPDWGTHNFDLDKPEVRSFLLSNAFFWCEQYHVDGFRLDAVASMLYLDYSREENKWKSNIYGGNEHLGAVEFLQDLNEILHRHYPSVLTIAEESSGWPQVTEPVDAGGLGFDYKWNMGWMNDTLHYFECTPEERLKQSRDITFPVTYAFDERCILPLSHDEVVHLKKSLWAKMPGSEDQKFSQLKLLWLYMIGCPGKKLSFMGNELAQKREWSESDELDWPLLDQNEHKQVQLFLKQLLHFYQSEPALFKNEDKDSCFRWANLNQKGQAVFSFCRGEDAKLRFCFNFSDQKEPCFVKGAENREYVRVFDTAHTNIKDTATHLTSFPIELEPFQGMLFCRTTT